MEKRASVATISLSNNFPQAPVPELPRDNISDVVVQALSTGIEVVVLEGEPGVGKTTLLSQFVRRHYDLAVSLFVQPTSRWSYDPQVIQSDLCNQMHRLVYNKALSEHEDAGESTLRRLMTKLRRKSGRKHLHYYFVVDGLSDLPSSDSDVRSSIIGQLPFGLGFKFLLAGDASKIRPLLHSSVRSTTQILAPLSLPETARYLSDITEDMNELQHLHELSRGLPGHLATVRRIVKSGTSLASLLENLPEEAPDLLRMEWKTRNLNDTTQVDALALLAHESRPYTVDGLASFCGVQSSQVRDALGGLSFLKLDEKSGIVSYVSDAFKRFAARELSESRDAIRDRLIDRLMEVPGSADALAFLPGHLDRAGRYRDLLEYLSPETVVKVLAADRSLAGVYQKAALGMATASRLGKDPHIMRFSMHRTAIAQLGRSQLMKSEVEARMLLDGFERARDLVSGVVFQEDRLYLLSVISRIARQKGDPVGEDTCEELRVLASRLGPQLSRDKAADVAVELVATVPDAAMKLLEAAPPGGGTEAEQDWEYVRLVAAAQAGKQPDSNSGDVVDQIRARINHPAAKRVSAAIAVVLGKVSSEEVIRECQNMSDPDEQIHLLRIWCSENSDNPQAGSVIEHALATVVSATQYTPNARAYREIAIPLPALESKEQARALVSRFDAQRVTVERLGPTEDCVRLELLMARAEANFEWQAARARCIAAYHKIEQLADIAVKTACLARLAVGVQLLDPARRLEDSDGLHTIVEHELDKAFARLLDESFDHYEATKRVIRGLAKHAPERAKRYAGQLNTQPRRDAAMVDIVKRAIDVPLQDVPFELLRELCADIGEDDLVEAAQLCILERLSTESEIPESTMREIRPIMSAAIEIEDLDGMCHALSLSYRIEGEAESPNATNRERFMQKLDASWKLDGPGWVTADRGFELSASLAASDCSRAREYVDDAVRMLDTESLRSGDHAAIHFHGTDLALRAMAGLLPRRLESEGEVERVERLIASLADDSSRAAMWSRFALHYFFADRASEGQRLVADRLRPAIENAACSGRHAQTAMIVEAAPALYMDHKSLAFDMLQRLRKPESDLALARIATVIRQKTLAHDPCHNQGNEGWDLTYGEVADLLEIANRATEDVLSYGVLRDVANTVCGRHRDRFSKNQKADVATKIEAIVGSKFPATDYIRHDGYVVLGLSQAARIQGGQSKSWDDLVRRARAIANLSDRAFVLMEIGRVLPRRQKALARQLFEEASEILRPLCLGSDKANRLEALAEAWITVDPKAARRCLSEALESVTGVGYREASDSRRRIIDAAHRLDPEFAESLAASLDDDPARKTECQKRVERLAARETIAEDPSGLKAIRDRRELQRVAWQMLSQMNAGQVAPLKSSQVATVLDATAELTMQESFPVYLWVVEGLVRSYRNNAQAATILRPFCEAIIKGAEVSLRMIEKAGAGDREDVARVETQESPSTVYVRAGERPQALRYVREWLESEAREFVKICDPYFGLEELEFLKLLRECPHVSQVCVVTSRKWLQNQQLTEPWEECFRVHWRTNISAQRPPATDVIVVGREDTGESPIHDRWLITRGGGLRFGTSLRSLGGKKDSEISVMGEDEVKVKDSELNQIIERKKRESQGVRLRYLIFEL